MVCLGDLLKALIGDVKSPATLLDGPKCSRKALADFANLVSLATNHMLSPLQKDEDLADFRPVFAVTCQLLNTGYFFCIRQIGDYIMHLGRVSNQKAIGVTFC